MSRIQEELRSRRAIEDPYYWLTECTRTKDEQDALNPFKPFPRKLYIRVLLEMLAHEPVFYLWKSRTMMASWTCCGKAAHMGFTRPATGVIFQSQDETRAVKCIEYVKTLWEESTDDLRKRWPCRIPPWKQSYNRFELDNKSWFWGIPGDPQKIRSEHPTIVMFDECAIMEHWEEAYNTAMGTRTPHIWNVSSAFPGPYADVYEASTDTKLPPYLVDLLRRVREEAKA